MSQWDSMGSNLIFIFSPPRSGSTMLQLMLESHSLVAGASEPHVMVPLRYTGYYGQPEKADYDTINVSLAIREFVDHLPGGEQDYLGACRAYAGTMYQKAMTGKPASRYLVEKTPSNILEWPFIVKVFPAARYVVLVRHPLAIFHSFAETFFGGDYEMARRESNVLQRYIPRITAFMREAPVKKISVAYEQLVQEPEPEARRILKILGLDFEPAVVEYGQVGHRPGSMGDAVTAYSQDRPVDTFVDRWSTILGKDNQRRRIARELIAQCHPNDLAVFGYPLDQLFDNLKTASAADRALKSQRQAFNFYLLKRRIFIMLRTLARSAWVIWILKRIRYYCDVLLRE